MSAKKRGIRSDRDNKIFWVRCVIFRGGAPALVFKGREEALRPTRSSCCDPIATQFFGVDGVRRPFRNRGHTDNSHASPANAQAFFRRSGRKHNVCEGNSIRRLFSRGKRRRRDRLFWVAGLRHGVMKKSIGKQPGFLSK